MNVLLLSAYDAPSHARWRRGLTRALPELSWTVETLPPRHFAWRVRGNSLTFAFERADVLRRPFDLLVATSMTDLASLRGFVPELAHCPTLVYFHENQFAYPTRPGVRPDVHPQLTSLYTALCADRLAFNSPYNRDTFLAGARALLERLPDGTPAGLVERLAARAIVLPVGLEASCFAPAPASDPAPDPGPARRARPLQILWNHRWEYDKAPERFFDALFELSRRGRRFGLHVVGQQFRAIPPIFERARAELATHIETWGYLDRADDYRALLATCDVVVSTSLHEFQGLAVLEAVAAGARPLVPDRMAYRDFIPARYRYASHPDDPAAERGALVAALEALCDEASAGGVAPARDALESVEALRWDRLARRYRALFDSLVAAAPVTEGGDGLQPLKPAPDDGSQNG